jgi:hypothetical protein
MSEEKLRLPDFLIADLYKHTLVEVVDQPGESNDLATETTPVKVGPGSSDRVKYLGENSRNVIIIVNQPTAVFLADKDLQFLTNILKACSLTLAEIAIINLANEKVDFTRLKEELGAVHIFLFDVQPTEIKVPFVSPHFQVQKFDGANIIFLPSLSEMNLATDESVQLKRNLWTMLKKVFGI